MNQSILNQFITQVAALSSGRLAILGVILSGVYYATAFNDGGSIRQNMITLNAQISEEQIKKIETTRVLQKEEQMRADVTMLVKKYEDVKSKIPIEFLESELRIIIDQYANQYEIKTTKNLRATKIKDFGTSQDSNLVEQIALEYIFIGSYFNLEKFIRQVSTLDKLIKIENFQISSDGKLNPKGSLREISLSATIIGFKQSMVSLNENKSEGKK